MYCTLSDAVLYKIFQTVQPQGGAGIAGHAQISSGRDRHASHLRSVRQTGTFELLGKKPPHKGFQPF